MTEAEQREAIIAEALTWQGTPHHNGARLKGAGVDCGHFPLAVYHACGLLPEYDPGRYSPQFFMHRTETGEKPREWYKEITEGFGMRIDTPEKGDFVLYKVGLIYSHGAIVIEWPRIIHAAFGMGVVQDIGNQGRLGQKKREPIFYTWRRGLI